MFGALGDTSSGGRNVTVKRWLAAAAYIVGGLAAGALSLWLAPSLWLEHGWQRAFNLLEQKGLVRRSFAARVERYELGARLYHWGNAAVLVLLIVTGAGLFVPGLPPPGISWLLAHEILASTFIVLLVVHIVTALALTDAASMWRLNGRDGDELRASLRFFFRREPVVPRTGKYDVWQKLYHALLTLLALASIVTGISLFLNTEGFATFGHAWMRWQRLVHDAAAFLFLAFIIGHVYVRLLKLNWPVLRSMFTGTMTRAEFDATRDWRRWQPPAADASHRDKRIAHRHEATEHRDEPSPRSS